MAAKLSSRILMTMLALAALAAAFKPALLAHLVMISGLLLIFAWRDERSAFATGNSVTAVLLGLALAWAAASLQWSPLPARGMYDLVILIVFAALILQLPSGITQLNDATTDRALKLFIALAAAAMLVFVMDCAFRLVWQRAMLRMDWEDQLFTSVISRSGYCMLLMLWPLMAYAMRRHWNLLAFFIWIALGIAIILSYSASGKVAYVASSLTFLLALRWPKLVRIVMMAVLLMGVVMAVPAAKLAQDLLEGSGKPVASSFLHRTEIWKFTAARIAEKPIMGWGFDSGRAIPNKGAISKYQGNDPLKSIIPMHPHNWFLHVLLELGIVGMVLMMSLWLWLLHQVSTLHRTVQPAALGTYSIAMVIGAFSIGVWQHWWTAALVLITIVLQLLNHEAHRARQ